MTHISLADIRSLHYHQTMGGDILELEEYRRITEHIGSCKGCQARFKFNQQYEMYEDGLPDLKAEYFNIIKTIAFEISKKEKKLPHTILFNEVAAASYLAENYPEQKRRLDALSAIFIQLGIPLEEMLKEMTDMMMRGI